MIDGVVFERQLPDGRVVTVLPLTFGRARVTVGRGSWTYDDGWLYPTLAGAVSAAQQWDGTGDPPDGWIRHLSTGRRRPDGDPAGEYQRW